MNHEQKILDHGYLRLIETYGSDESIIEAARMSTGKGFSGWGPLRQCQASDTGTVCCVRSPMSGPLICGHNTWREVPGDEKLLRYLWENKHATPFEMAGATFEVQAPILVFREWHRHRTQSYNEMSARYTPLPAIDYIPSIERLMMGNKGKESAHPQNKQSGTIDGAEILTLNAAEQFQARLAAIYAEQEDLYQWALTSGVPKELARAHLPVGRYSRMRASANLRNWLAFLTLRSTAKNKAAQWEIRQFADALGIMLANKFPRTMALFNEGAQ